MASKNKKKIDLLCTAFRDGFQSVFGMRVLSKDYMPVVGEAVKAGITNIEAGGGAAFQSAFFYCNENAFDVMDKFRETVGPKVKLQTLSRGVNVVALDSQSSDMIDLHAKLFKKHGMTTIRNFDALNDPNNLIYSAKCIKKAGLKHQLCVSMMSLPPGAVGAHTPDFYEDTLKKFIKAKIPYDSICFKDASGTTTPSVVYETVKRARKLLGDDTVIEFHSHETAGTGLVCYMAAIEAGADIVDLSMAPVSGGTCQPDIATLWHALRGKPYDLNCDIDAVMQVEEHLKEALKDYFMPPEALHVEPMIPWSPMPGGALTANTQMLRDNNLMDKYGEIIKAMEEVVRKGGYGTSVTPVSQFYFQQAFNNVMNGSWQKIADGYGKMVLGYFGKTPVEPDKKVVQIAAEQMGLKPTKETVLSLNDKNPAKSRAHYEGELKKAGLPITDENVFIAASCGQKGIDFLLGKGKVAVRYNQVPKCETTAKSDERYQITISGQTFDVTLNGDVAEVNGVNYPFEIAAEQVSHKTANGSADNNANAAGSNTTLPQGASKAQSVLSGTPGTITQVLVQEGDAVREGQDLCILEVMKMETKVRAPQNGVIGKVYVHKGEQVVANQKLFEVK